MVAKKTDKAAHKPVKIETRKKEVRYMSVAEWHAVPSNPRQPRDQVLRAPKALHLHTFIPNLHEEVYMAEDQHGNVWKLTAHTRGEVWYQGLSDAIPARVCVTVIPVRDEEEAGRLCLFYDSREAVNTSADLIHGALVYHGVPMTSPMFQTAKGMPTSLRYAYELALASLRMSKNKSTQQKLANFPPVRRATAIDFVGAFKSYLVALDAMQPGSRRGKTLLFTGPLLTSYFLGASKHGVENIRSFFEKLHDGNCGVQKNGRRDPIAHVEWVLDKRVGQARHEHFQCVARILAALEVYMEGDFAARDENGKSTYQPKVSIGKDIMVDLDVYLVENNVRRSGRRSERNSILKDSKRPKRG